jgi:DNA-binding ferritin-like protein
MDGSTVSIVGDAVETGSGSLEPHVCGDTWQSIMEELIDEISQIIVPTGVGPSGTPQNAAKFSSIKQKLKNALSSKHTVEK